jgi:hypothetical protein
MWLLQNFIRPCILGNETWGQSIGHFKILNVQPHMLPNFKFNMFLCFIGMFFISFLNLLQKLFSSVIFIFTPFDQLHNFLGMIFLSHGNGYVHNLASKLFSPMLIQTKTSLLSNELWSYSITLLGLNVHPIPSN